MLRGAESTAATVLVVEDDPAVAHLVELAIADSDFQTFCAGTVAEARSVLAQGDVDVVVCDVRLPDGSGIDLVREIAAQLPDTAVFMLSGDDDPDVAREALALGATAYVVKPFQPNEILINVVNSLRLRDLERARRRQITELESKLGDRNRALHDALATLASRDSVDESATVERLAAALSMRDEETSGHMERMSRYAERLGRDAGVRPEELDQLRRASMLHDVGKIGIPDHILLTAGPLTPDDRKVIERHPELGFTLLSAVNAPLLSLAASIALTHHERWDGTGYPHGLRADAIPLEGRIAAVADVFDALTSDRVYRPAMSVDEAVAIVEEGSENHFDPALVELFLEHLDDYLSLRDQHQEPPAAAAVKVLIVDDHRLFAESIARLLGRERAVIVTDVVATMSEAITSANDNPPDVVLMDWALPDGDGASAARQLLSAHPRLKIVMVTGRADDATLLASLQAGCVGMLSKAETSDKLMRTVLDAASGRAIIATERLSAVLTSISDRRSRQFRAPSARELEVLQLVASGRSIEEVANHLHLSTVTIRNHLQSAMQSLGAHSRLEAVTLAARQGLIRIG